MIRARTGLPGSGKTLSSLQYALRELKAGRPVFILGVKDCAIPGFVEWDKGIEDWQQLPQNSILIVDEAQQHLPVRRGTGAPPKWIEDLALHRHLGIDILLITQDPRFLDSFVRRLVGEHIHLVRRFGMSWARTYRWEEMQEDPKAGRSTAETGVFSFDKSLFGQYHSAEVHTAKGRIPKSFYLLGAAMVTCLALGYFAVYSVLGISDVPPVDTGAAVPASAGTDAPMSLADSFLASVRRTIPRVPSKPWTAPQFDHLQLEAAIPPRLFCVWVEHGRCQCYTDQATRYEGVDVATCKDIARYGQYEPEALRRLFLNPRG